MPSTPRRSKVRREGGRKEGREEGGRMEKEEGGSKAVPALCFITSSSSPSNHFLPLPFLPPLTVEEISDIIRTREETLDTETSKRTELHHANHHLYLCVKAKQDKVRTTPLCSLPPSLRPGLRSCR
jgi:hypothetical protein